MHPTKKVVPLPLSASVFMIADMRKTRRSGPVAILLGAIVATAAVPLSEAKAERGAAHSLNATEAQKLLRGETVVRPQTWEPNDSAHYVGAVTYTLIDSAAMDVSAMLEDPDAIKKVLPRAKHVRRLRVEPNGDQLMEVTHRAAMVDASYTLRLRPVPNSHEVRFWLEPTLLGSARDAWGYFRVAPAVAVDGQSRTLLTYAVLVDVGPGIVRELFESKVRDALLSVPQRMRHFVAVASRP